MTGADAPGVNFSPPSATLLPLLLAAALGVASPATAGAHSLAGRPRASTASSAGHRSAKRSLGRSASITRTRAAAQIPQAPPLVPVPKPAVVLTTKPSNPASTGSATIAFTTTGASSTACSIDGGPFVGCISPVSYLSLSTGTHTFVVKAHTTSGDTAASYAWTVGGLSPLGVSGHWTLTFDDEFNGSSLDLTKWQPNWLGADNTAVTPPDNGDDQNCMNPSQVSVGGGYLHLTAVARPCTADNKHTYPYTSGLVNTRKSFTFTYGYAEARIYVPASASGVPVNFPAFWANGTGTWPSTGELDVMEVLNSCGPGEGFHFHSNPGAFGGCPTAPVRSGWHTFGADWQPGVVTYYYDGVQVGHVTQGITGSPMYLILNNSVDPTYGGPTQVSSDLQVDYVRVWQ